MKFATTFLLPAVVSAAVLDSRQAPKGVLAPAQQYKFTTKDLKAQLRTNSKRTLTRVGPLDLTAGVRAMLRSFQLLQSNNLARTPVAMVSP
jgi:hypothetical protein